MPPYVTTHAGIFQLLGESDPRTSFLQACQDLLLVITNAGDNSQASNHCTFHSIPLPLLTYGILHRTLAYRCKPNKSDQRFSALLLSSLRRGASAVRIRGIP
ncbi:hypothetical protein GSMA_02349 [Serratia marcescens subsp. marcescens ATCC 13880]|nr:hypothetical protein GSMA_02349 [Serratia marcescens subsp. marcescens ATCC 13880]